MILQEDVDELLRFAHESMSKTREHRTRKLSSLTLVHQEATAALLNVLARLQRGFAPMGSEAHAPPVPPMRRDAYDDRLDEELAKL